MGQAGAGDQVFLRLIVNQLAHFFRHKIRVGSRRLVALVAPSFVRRTSFAAGKLKRLGAWLIALYPPSFAASFHILILMNTTIDFDKSGGLVPAIAQDAATGQVLMLAWMNREAYEETVRTGRAVYFSRSRNKLWRKGEESGNVQEVKEVYVDCDADTILLKVHQIGGAACHEGYQSCFFRKLEGDRVQVIGERLFDPKAVYK